MKKALPTLSRIRSANAISFFALCSSWICFFSFNDREYRQVVFTMRPVFHAEGAPFARVIVAFLYVFFYLKEKEQLQEAGHLFSHRKNNQIKEEKKIKSIYRKYITNEVPLRH